jgi:hypothetical protein
MGSVTWLGEDGSDVEEATAFGSTFKKGEAVEVEDEGALRKLSKNRFFKVEGYEERPDGAEHKDKAVFRAPSEQPAQGPVEKPGEPVFTGELPPKQPDPPEDGAPDVESKKTWPKI